MKKSFSLLILVFIYASLFAQAPESFSYQAVVRDVTGNVVPNQPVTFQISLISGSMTGTVEYVETHSLVTNSFGLVTMPVGGGTVVSGTFSLIDWGLQPFFMKVELDVLGGTSYADMGTVQLISVPYALYAKKAGNGFSGDFNDLTNQPDFTNWDQNVSNDFSGDYQDLINKPELNGDVTGQIDANTVTKIQGMDVSSNIPANGQILKWNNSTSTWEPSDDQLGAAGTTDGVVTGANITGTTTKTLTLIRSNGLGDITASFTDLVDDADANPTNELQTLSLSANNLSISSGNSVSLAPYSYIAGSGIDMTGNVITNTSQDVEVTLNGATGISVTGVYPDFTLTNTLPDQPLVLIGSGSTTVSGTYPNYTITSTDNNTVYTEGTGIDITSNVITNTAPDQTVTLTGSGSTSVTGTYPNFIIASTDNVNDADANPNNEIQSLSIAGNNLTISGSNTVTLPQNVYTSGTGINISSNVISNTSPDQPVVLNNGTGINVSGTYPSFTITNTSPNQPVTLTGSGAATVTGTYPNFNVSSTDNNTTYTAGTGLTLTGTQFTHNAHSGDVTGTTALTVTAVQGRQVTSNAPANGQILKWNTTNNRWELADDELGAAGTNDGVVTSIGVSGTTTKTITLTRSQSLPDLTATFTDAGSVYTGGTGINITGTTVTNTAPDQTVSLTGTGATSVTGTYPNFTVSSTDNNTTYSAGAGLSLTGTTFNNTQNLSQTLVNGNNAGTSNIEMNGQDINSVDVMKLRSDNAAYIDMYYGHIYDYAGSHGVAGQALIVRGTSPNTWVRWESPSSFLTPGTGIGISGSTITNTSPDQTVSLTAGGATTITGTYPNFTISSTSSGGTVTSIAANNGITGGTITTTGTLGLTGQALALHNLGTNGLITRTAAGTVTARTITGSTGIQVTNGDGVSGNPTLTPIFGTISGTIAEGTHTHGSYGVAGTNGMVQFNNNGVFGGVQNLIWDNTNYRLTINGLSTTGQQSNLIVRQTTNAVNSTRDSAVLANMGLDIRQNSTSSYYASGLKFTVGNADIYTGTAAIFAERTGSWSQGDLHFAVNDAGLSGKTAIPIRMTIKNSGKIGIGTTSPTAQFEIKSLNAAPNAEPLFQVKNKAGQPIFIVYEDSVRIFIDDDPAKTNKGAFAVSGRNTSKAFTNNFLWVAPDSSRVYTGDPDKGFGVRNINGANLESYMKVTPGNTIVGLLAGSALTNGMYNTMIGYKAGTNTTGGIITYPDFNGSYNIFVGYEAGRNNTTGGMNVFIGNYAGQLAISGVKNTCVGNQSMQANTTGGYNSAFGYNSGIQTTGSYNSFFSTDVAFYNTTGSNNAYFGSHAGEYFNGSSNTFIGSAAGRNASTVRTGSSNIFIGASAGSASGSVSNKLYIDPTSTNTPLIEGDFSTNSVEINGNLCYTGTFGACSDIRYKKDFEPLHNSLSKIMQINGYYYKWRYEEFPEMVFSQGRQLGVIAQDVEKLFPELITQNEDGYKMVDYARLTPVIIEAIKEQQQQIDALKKENEELKGVSAKVDDLTKRCTELEKQLGTTSQR